MAIAEIDLGKNNFAKIGDLKKLYLVEPNKREKLLFPPTDVLVAAASVASGNHSLDPKVKEVQFESAMLVFEQELAARDGFYGTRLLHMRLAELNSLFFRSIAEAFLAWKANDKQEMTEALLMANRYSFALDPASAIREINKRMPITCY